MIRRLFKKLPPSTDAVTCRWFITIMLMSLGAFGWGWVMLPGTVPTVCMVIAVAVMFFVLGMRDWGRTAHTCRYPEEDR